ncbi:MAG: DeoR/GlpR family DNA-binding transcription regulator [Synergistaceae bacterium]|nr:DeoR/GlpR family DNA-binding transcription regulator [Synergistaceae bacterium]
MTRSTYSGAIPIERQRKILDELRGRGVVAVDKLVELLGVSESTIRRDLEDMSKKGLVSRTHGGAVSPSFSTAYEKTYAEKKMMFFEEKRRIGSAAAKLVADGETVILDSGSTTFEVARHLTSRRGLKIITNDLSITGEVDYDPSNSVILTGGLYSKGLNLLAGSETENFYRNIRVNKAFLAADAIDMKNGVFNAAMEDASVKKVILEVAREVILVSDHSKFGRTSLSKVCDIAQLHMIITDRGLDQSYQQELRRMNSNFMLV